MKTMYVMLAGLFLLCVSVVNAQTGNEFKSKLKGKWVITVPDAPDGMQNYNAEIKEKDGAMLMDFKGGDVDVKDQKFTEKDGKLSLNIYVGEYVKIVIWEEKSAIKGSADTSMGILPFNMKKADEKKK